MSASKESSLQARRERLEEDLNLSQRQIFEAEEAYFSETFHHGNVIKGWEGFLVMTELRPSSSARKPKMSDRDRIFSQSSKSAGSQQHHLQLPHPQLAFQPEGALTVEEEPEEEELALHKRRRPSSAPRRHLVDEYD